MFKSEKLEDPLRRGGLGRCQFGLILAITAMSGAAHADDIVCKGFEREWATVSRGTDVGAMTAVIKVINPNCKNLLIAAMARRNAVEIDISRIAAERSARLMAAANSKSAETILWRSVAESNEVAQYKAYLSRYPSGEFAALAKAKIATLMDHPAPVLATDVVGQFTTSSRLATPTASGPGAWRAATAASPLSDANGFIAYLGSENELLNDSGAPERAVLVVRCADGDLAMFVLWPQVVNSEIQGALLNFPQATVVTRLDDVKLSVSFWDIGDGGRVVGKFLSGGAGPLLASIATSEKLVVRIAGHATQEAVFDLDGIDQIKSRALAACGVSRGADVIQVEMGPGLASPY